MKTRMLKIGFALTAMLLIMPVHGQLFTQFKEETVNYTYLQFPTQKERKSAAEFEIITENMLGKMANKVIKNDAIAGALTQKGGVLGAESDESSQPMGLIPAVFSTDGDIKVEVTFTPGFKTKETMDVPIEVYNKDADEKEVELLASFKVFGLPDKELLYTQDQVYINSSISQTAFTAGGETRMNEEKGIVRSWAKNKIFMMYGLGKRTVELPVYRIKQDNRDDKNKAKEMQETLMSCATTLLKNRKGEEYEAKVDKCINYYNDMLRKYQPGTEKQKESLVTDKNVWCLYHNLSVAYTLLGNKAMALQFMEKGVDIGMPKAKDIIGRDGEKKGSFTFGIYHGAAPLSQLRDVTTSYFKGLDNMNPVFVELVTSKDDIFQSSRIAREWAGNIMLSEMFGYDVPVNFVSASNGNDSKPSLVSGTINGNGEKVNYTFKKQLLSFLTHKYNLKASNSDLSRTTKQHYSDYNFLPAYYDLTGGYSLYIGDKNYANLVSGTEFKPAKNADKTRYWINADFQYDYNGDILVKVNMLKDKFWFYNYVNPNESETLGHTEIHARITHDENYNVKSVEIETSEIERDRKPKFFEAFLQKKVAPGDPLETTETVNETTSKKLIYNDSEVKVVKDGKTQSMSLARQKNDKGDCVKMSIGDCQVERNYTY